MFSASPLEQLRGKTKIAGINPRRPRRAPAPPARAPPARGPARQLRTPARARGRLPAPLWRLPRSAAPEQRGTDGQSRQRTTNRPRQPLPTAASCARGRRHYCVTSLRGARERRVCGRRGRAHAHNGWSTALPRALAALRGAGVSVLVSQAAPPGDRPWGRAPGCPFFAGRVGRAAGPAERRARGRAPAVATVFPRRP